MSLLTPKQVAERIQLSRSVVSRLCSSGELAHHRIGSSLRISEQDLEAFLARTKKGEPVEQPRTMPNAEIRAALAIVVGPGRPRKKKQIAAPE